VNSYNKTYPKLLLPLPTLPDMLLADIVGRRRIAEIRASMIVMVREIEVTEEEEVGRFEARPRV